MTYPLDNSISFLPCFLKLKQRLLPYFGYHFDFPAARLGNAACTPKLHHISRSLHVANEPFSMLDSHMSRLTCSSSAPSDFLALSDSRVSHVPHSMQSLQDLSGLKRSALNMDVACSSETSVPTYKTTRCQNPEVLHFPFFSTLLILQFKVCLPPLHSAVTTSK